jgi:hypothetical protein
MVASGHSSSIDETHSHRHHTNEPRASIPPIFGEAVGEKKYGRIVVTERN